MALIPERSGKAHHTWTIERRAIWHMLCLSTEALPVSKTSQTCLMQNLASSSPATSKPGTQQVTLKMPDRAMNEYVVCNSINSLCQSTAPASAIINTARLCQQSMCIPQSSLTEEYLRSNRQCPSPEVSPASRELMKFFTRSTRRSTLPDDISQSDEI